MGNLNEGLAVTVIGMIIVFAVLILLWAILEGMRFVFYRPNEKPTASNNAVNSDSQPAQQNNINNEHDIEDEDEDELIAVLTAAIAASLNQSTYNLKIKSFRRIGQTSPVWNTVSRKEQIENKL